MKLGGETDPFGLKQCFLMQIESKRGKNMFFHIRRCNLYGISREFGISSF